MATCIPQRMVLFLERYKELCVQSETGLAWQRVAGLLFLGVLEGSGSEAEASYSFKIV